MLQLIDVACVRGGQRLFEGVSLTVKAGDILYISGKNGCGKTSMLRTLTGLSKPEHGQILWNQQSIHDMDSDYLMQLLYLGHQPALKDELTVRENLSFYMDITQQSQKAASLKEALAAVGLSKHARLPVRVLSQGQKRRLALARLWLENKLVWVLDEPFNALDAAAIDWLSQKIQTHAEQGGMVVLTSHQPLQLNAIKQLRLDA